MKPTGKSKQKKSLLNQSIKKITPLNQNKQQSEQYTQFLEKKINQQQYLTHLIHQDITSLKNQNEQLKKLVTKLRQSQRKYKQRLNQLQSQNQHQKQIIIKLNRNLQSVETKIKQFETPEKLLQLNQPIQTKIVFKKFLTSTFPLYKDTIKRILRFFMYAQKFQSNGKDERIKTYHNFIKSIVSKLMNWIFPKQSQSQLNKSIAQNMVDKWKENQSEIQRELKREIFQLKNNNAAQFLKIQSYEAEMLRIKAGKNMLEGKVSTYERSMKVKAAQFVVHFKKALVNRSQYGQESQAINQMNEILQVLQSLANNSGQNKAIKQQQNRNQILAFSNKSLPGFNTFDVQVNGEKTSTIKQKNTPATLLKKNIYGYYEQPQFATKWNYLSLTKHPDLNKYTQTLPDDLTILITRPVLLLRLFDGNIRPQRTRHNTQFYVRIHKNSQSSLDSLAVNSVDYQPFWNNAYLIKNYDFPNIKVQLMNKSKGLKDKSIGQGKLLVEPCQQKIVNIRKEKQYQGRVRFGIFYPKGNIFEFVINSVQLVVPDEVKILTEIVQISVPMNQIIVEKFTLKNLVNYLTNKSVIITQGMQGQMEGRISNRKLSGSIALNQFTDKQGSKKVTIQVQQNWQIILQGYIVLIVSEQSQPQRITQAQADKFFAVRAGHPLINAKYNNQVLYSHVKLPLVFRYLSQATCLSCILQSPTLRNSTQQEIIDPLIVQNTQNQLRKHQLLSTPPHVYKFFIQTLQGPQVKFAYQSLLYVRLPQKIKLQIQINKLNDNDNDNQNQDPLLKKGKRVLLQQAQHKIQFFIETKDLMPNFYKILSKTYKITGYSKYKIGYCKITNLLSMEGPKQAVKQVKAAKKQIQLQQPLKGQYYVQFQISKAFLPSFSSSSKYRIQITDNQQSQLTNNVYKTQQLSGIHPQWSYKIMPKLRFGQKTPQLKIKVYEISLLIKSEKIIFQTILMVTLNVLKLGKIILNINMDENKEKVSYNQNQSKSFDEYIENQNIIILSGIKIPQHIFSLYVSDIQIEVQQQADWFSKIDPYIIFYTNGRQSYKTKVIDNSGDNTLWQNINFKTVVKQVANKQDKKYQLFECRIFDQDLINDDYLGKGFVIFDSQIMNSDEQISCIHTSIIKDEKVCGSIRVNGKFKRIRQQARKIISKSYTALDSKSDMILQICLTDVELLSEISQLEENQMLKVVYSQAQAYKSYSKQLKYTKQVTNESTSLLMKNMKNINFSIWKVYSLLKKSEQTSHNNIIIKLFKQKKHFFKKSQFIQFGSITLELKDYLQVNIATYIKVDIMAACNQGSKQKSNNKIGYCYILVQPIYDMKYCVIDAYSSGLCLDLESKYLSDAVKIIPTSKYHLNSLMEEFQDIYLMAAGDVDKYLNTQHNQDSIQRLNTNIKIKQIDCLNGQFILTRKQVTFINTLKPQSKINYQSLVVYNIHKQQSYMRQVQSLNLTTNSLLNIKDKRIPKLFKVKILHWQPIKFKQSLPLIFNLKFKHATNQSQIQINYKLNQVFNSYYAFNSSQQNQSKLSIPMIFSEDMLPQKIEIYQNKNKQVHQDKEISKNGEDKITIQLLTNLSTNLINYDGKQYQQNYANNSLVLYPSSISKNKHIFLKDQGALYYQLQQYKQKYRRVLFKNIYIRLNEVVINKLKQKKNKRISNQLQSLNSLDDNSYIITTSIKITESSIVYSNPKRIGKYGFYFQNVQFFIPTQHTNNKITLLVNVQKLAANNDQSIQQHNFELSSKISSISQSSLIVQLKVQLKAKLNQFSIQYLTTQQYILHSTLIIQSDMSINNEPIIHLPPCDISFIQLQFIKLYPAQNLLNNEIKVVCSIHNQFIQMNVKRESNSNRNVKRESNSNRNGDGDLQHSSNKANQSFIINQKQLLYIYQHKQPIIVKIQLIQQKLFGNKTIGWGNIEIDTFSLDSFNGQIITVNGQIKNQKGLTLGKVQMSYKRIQQMKYLYVDIDKVITKYQKYPQLTVQLIPFGSSKVKTQKVNLRLIETHQSIQSIKLYDTSEDLIVCQNDYQDYNIHVSIRQTKQLIGKFKLCDLINKQNHNDRQFISAIHPLRLEKNYLNGLVSINYAQYVSSRKVINNRKEIAASSKREEEKILKLTFTKFKFINSDIHQQQLQLMFMTSSRKIYTQKLKWQPSVNNEQQLSQNGFQILIKSKQKFNIILLINQEQKGYTQVDITTNTANNNNKQSQQIIVFNSYDQSTSSSSGSMVYGICCMQVKKHDANNQFYELIDISANKLNDTQIFVDMNPYVKIQMLENTNNGNKQLIPINQVNKLQRNLITSPGQGNNNLYWKLAIIIDKNIKLSVYDKDIKFDDHIGDAQMTIQQVEKQFRQKNINNAVLSEKDNQIHINKKIITKIINIMSNQDLKYAGQIKLNIRRIQISHNNKKQQFNPLHIEQHNNQLSTTKQQTTQLYILRLGDFNLYDLIKQDQQLKEFNIISLCIYFVKSDNLYQRNCIYSMSIPMTLQKGNENVGNNDQIGNTKYNNNLLFQSLLKNGLILKDYPISLESSQEKHTNNNNSNYNYNNNNKSNYTNSQQGKSSELKALIELKLNTTPSHNMQQQQNEIINTNKSTKTNNIPITKTLYQLIQLNNLNKSQKMVIPSISVTNNNKKPIKTTIQELSKQKYQQLFLTRQLILLQDYLLLCQQQQKSNLNQNTLKLKKNNVINISTNKFLINRFYFWFDFKSYTKIMSLYIKIFSNAQSKSMRVYSVDIDLSSTGMKNKDKNGIQFVEFEVEKYLKHQIYLEENDIMEVFVFSKGDDTGMVDKGCVDVKKIIKERNKQENHSNKRFVLQANLQRQIKNPIKIGTMFVQLQKYQIIMNKANKQYLSLGIPKSLPTQLKQSKQNVISSSHLYKYLSLTIHKAQFIKDIQWISKMDPYCQIHYSNPSFQQVITKQYKHKTSTQQNIGKNPVWNQIFYIQLLDNNKTSQQIKLIFKDEEITMDRAIGQAVVKIDLGQLNEKVAKQYKLKIYKNQTREQQAGDTWISCKLSYSCLVVTKIDSPLHNKKQLQIKICYQGNQNKQQNYQHITMFKPYPVMNDLAIVIKINDEVQQSINLKQIQQRLAINNFIYIKKYQLFIWCAIK